jgi:hypothetical protein
VALLAGAAFLEPSAAQAFSACANNANSLAAPLRQPAAGFAGGRRYNWRPYATLVERQDSDLVYLIFRPDPESRIALKSHAGPRRASGFAVR